MLGTQTVPTKTGSIVVEVQQPVAEIKYLDGIYWPQGKACGRAYTYWTFICRPEFQIKELPSTKNNQRTFEVTAVSMKLALPLRTWLPYGVSDKLKAHEAGHIQMCRDIYKNAEAIAHASAEELMGRHIRAGGDAKTAREAAYIEASRTLDASYREKIETIANDTGVLFDSITNHGMNDIPESTGMRDSFIKYRAKHPDNRFVPNPESN